MHHLEQVIAQLVQVHFLDDRRGESLEGKFCIIPLAIETPVDEILDALTQRSKQSGDRQG